MIKKAHISIDDTINIFEDLNANRNYYDSIFANKTMGLLKELHDKYNMVFHLYCFCENMNASFNLNFCTDKYKKEFKKNRRWLKINFHGKNGHTNLTNLNLSEFKNLFCDFKFQINRICGLNLTKLTRLHNYNITYEQLLFLRSQKINKLFASEKIDIDCYNLKKHEKRLIKQKGVYLKDKMKYINVHIRLDNCQDVLKEIKKIDEHKIYIFMHEWMFYDNFLKMKSNIELIGKWAKETKCKFI